MNNLKKRNVQSGKEQAENHLQFIQEISGKLLEGALGFVKKCAINNTKHVYVVSKV